jgi:transposase
MAKLPLTVTSVKLQKNQLYSVTVAFFDGTTANYLVPETMATIEAVRISALVMGQLLDIVTPATKPHRVHQRYLPRNA